MALRKIDWAEDFLAKPRQSIYELVRRNQIPHTRIGRSVRFDEDLIREWARKGGTSQPNNVNDRTSEEQ